MPRAKLTLVIPAGVWIGDISRNHPGARVRILAAIAEDGAGVGLAEVTAPELCPVISEISGREEVTDIDIFARRANEAVVQFETDEPMLLMPLKDAGIPLEMPFDIEAGEVTWELTAPQHRLSALGDQLAAFGIEFTVEYVRQYVVTERTVTDRQRRLLLEAVERGYYDTPRECTLTELADGLGIAKSTCSEILHRAEEAVVKQFVEDQPASDREQALAEAGGATE
ncbi:MAG: helix-turn-helix domain-containing protein [Haloarculaceae archaeon]